MTRSKEHPIKPSFSEASALAGENCAAVEVGRMPSSLLLRALTLSAPTKAVTLPMYRAAPSNFGVKLARPGFGPAAELPTSAPA